MLQIIMLSTLLTTKDEYIFANITERTKWSSTKANTYNDEYYRANVL